MAGTEEQIFENIRYKLRKTVQHRKNSIDDTKLKSNVTASNPKMEKTKSERKNNKVTEVTQSIINPLCSSICKPISIRLTRLKYDELVRYKQKQSKVKRRTYWKYGKEKHKKRKSAKAITASGKRKSAKAITASGKRKSKLCHRTDDTKSEHLDVQHKIALNEKRQMQVSDPSPDTLLTEVEHKDECIKEVQSPIVYSNAYKKAHKFRRKRHCSDSESKTLEPRQRPIRRASRRVIISPSSEFDEDVDIDVLIDIPKCVDKNKEENFKASNLQEVFTPNICNSKKMKIQVIKLEDVTNDNEVIKWKQKQLDASHGLESVNQTLSDTETRRDIQHLTPVKNHSDICLEDIESDSSSTNALPLELQKMEVDVNIKQSPSVSSNTETIDDESDTLPSNFTEIIHSLKIPKVLLIKLDNLTASTDNHLCSNVENLTKRYVNNEINSNTLNSSDKAALLNHIYEYTMKEIEFPDGNQPTSSTSARTDLSINILPCCSSAPLFRHGSASKKQRKWITGSPSMALESERNRMVVIPRNLTREWSNTFFAEKSKQFQPEDSEEQLQSLSAFNPAEMPTLSTQNELLTNIEESCSTLTTSVSMSSRNVINTDCHMSPGEHSSRLNNIERIVPVQVAERESTSSVSDDEDAQELTIDENPLPGMQPTDSHSIVLETENDNIQSTMQDQLNATDENRPVISTPTSATSIEESKTSSQSPKKSKKRIHAKMLYDPVVSNLIGDDPAAMQQDLKKDRKKQEQITSKIDLPAVPVSSRETQDTVPQHAASERLVLHSTGLERSGSSKSRKLKTVVPSASVPDDKHHVQFCLAKGHSTVSEGNKSSGESSATKKQSNSDANMQNNKINDKGKRPKSRIRAFNDSLKCSVCSRNFETRNVLAHHLFTHTENELQEAFKSAHTKITLKMKNTLESSNTTCDSVDETMDEIDTKDKDTVEENPDINKTNGDQNKSSENAEGTTIDGIAEASDDLSETDNTADKTSDDVNNMNDSIIESVNNVDNSTQEVNTSMNVTNANVPCVLNQSETMLEVENKEIPEEKKIIKIASNAVSDIIEKSPEDVTQEETRISVPFVEVYLDPAGNTPIVLPDTAIGIQKPATEKTKAVVARKIPQAPEVMTIISDIDMDVNAGPILVCECHRNEIINKHSLKIEIVLMCYTCRMLFRSMECFETHYRLPERALCNKDRQHGRVPKLFCTNCGMIFSSVLEVRQHLETHARMNIIGTTDFRCNICKVIFIGVGTIFYMHWTNHIKNPFFLASRLSFPKASVIGTTYVKSSLTSTDDSVDMYIQIAEYVCNNCKKPFSTMEDLKKHEPTCTVKKPTSTVKSLTSTVKPPANTVKSPTSTVKSSTSTVKPPTSTVKSPRNTIKSPTCAVKQPTVENHADFQLICGRCDQVFFEKSAYEKHVKQNHLRPIDPQYVCVDLAATQRVFLCSICSYVSATVLEFEQHWSTHNICQDYYICTLCKRACSSLDAFQEHSVVHKTAKNKGPISCRIYSVDSRYFCSQCDLRFENEKALTDHYTLHNTLSLTDSKSAEGSTPVSHIVIDTTGLPSVPNPELLLNVQEDEVSKDVLDECVQIIDQESANSDTLTDIPENPSNPADEDIIIVKDLSAEKRGTQKQAAPVSVIKTVGPKASNCGTPTKAKKDANVKSPTKEKKEKENHKSDTKEVSDTSNDPSTSKSSTESKDTPAKGFLRVRPLAELTEKVKTLCNICGIAFDSNDAFAQHHKTHEKESPSTSDCVVVPINKASADNSGEGVKGNNQAGKPQTVNQTPSNVQPTLKKTPPVPIINIIQGTPKKLTSSKPSQSVSGPPKKNPSQPNWATGSGNNQSHKDPIPSATQNVSQSAYHKNLPPCNFGRPTGTQRTFNQPTSNNPRFLQRIAPRQMPREPIARSSTQNVPSTSGSQNIPAGFNMARNQTAHVRPQMNNTNRPESVIYPPTYQRQNIMTGGRTMVVPDTHRNTATSATVANNHLPEPQQIYHAQGYNQPIHLNYDHPHTAKQRVDWSNPNGNISQHHFVVLSSPKSNSIDIANSYYPPSTRTQFQERTGASREQPIKPRFFVCPYCPNSARFSTEDSICYHMNNAHKFICDICGQRSYTFEEWNIHKVQYHALWTPNMCQSTKNK